MNKRIYAIYDAKAAAYMEPFFLPNEDMAVRTFGDVANDPDHPMGKHPEDYHLVQVGSWDGETGKINPTPAPLTITTATALLRKGTNNA